MSSKFSDILKVGFMQLIKNQSISYIKNDRDRYKFVLDEIDDYCYENKIIISSKYVLCDELNTVEAIYDNTRSFYTIDPYRNAIKLANRIYRKMMKDESMKGESPLLRVETIIEHEELVIKYDTRILCTFYKIQKHKIAEPNLIIHPIEIGKYFCMPSEIEIIDIYHILYDPDMEKKWNGARKYEKILKDQILGRLDIIRGGRECKNYKKSDIVESLKLDTFNKWVRKSNHILIGQWATNWIRSGKSICVNLEKIQIIAFEKVEDAFLSFKNFAKKYTVFEPVMRKQDLNIPKDFRVTRYTVYLKIETEMGITEKPIMDIFNCCEYEIIPYHKINEVNIGKKEVILRFLFVDLWILRVIKNMKLITDDIAKKKADTIISNITFHDDYKNDAPIEYSGTFRSYTIDKKNYNLTDKRFYPIYPCVLDNTNNLCKRLRR